MSEESALDGAFAALSKFFVGDGTMHETLERVATMALEALPSAAHVGVTMLEDGRPTTGVFSDPEVPEVDQAQYAAGTGPCLDSFRTGEIFSIESTRTDSRWPDFRRACLEHGILSTVSLPMTVEGSTNGAMNFYARGENAFGAAQMRTASLFAAQAAIVLANANAYWTARAKAEQLEQALHSRAAIEQAKGIIMATTRCTPDEAFQILVRQSQQQNRKLRDVAEEIVALSSRRP